MVLRGGHPLTIKTVPVVQVTLTVAVTISEFYEENFVRNVAAALMINPMRIKVIKLCSFHYGIQAQLQVVSIPPIIV